MAIAPPTITAVIGTSSVSQALIKIYNALYFAQSIQLSNIVLISLLVHSYSDLPRVGGYGSYSVRGVQSPHFPPTQCSASKRLSLDRELTHGCRV